MEAMLINLLLTTMAIGAAYCLFGLASIASDSTVIEIIAKTFFVALLVSSLVLIIFFIISIWTCEW